MGVLASLLPGVRQLRAPLFSGYLWLLALWILLHDHVSRETASGPFEALDDLSGVATVVTLGIAVSFAAYLIGSLNETLASYIVGRTALSESSRQALTDLTVRQLNEIRSRVPFQWWQDHAPNLLNARYDIAEAYGHPSDPTDWLELGPVFGLGGNELPLAARRLIGQYPAQHAEYDRLRAEAELRVAIALPLVVFLVVFAWQADWAWWIVLIVVVIAVLLACALLLEAQARYRAANDFIVDLLVIDTIQLPTLERLKARAEQDAVGIVGPQGPPGPAGPPGLAAD